MNEISQTLQNDLLEKLLALNLDLAAKEQRGEPVVGPWDPDNSITPLFKGGQGGSNPIPKAIDQNEIISSAGRDPPLIPP